jgi:hypothetical protein
MTKLILDGHFKSSKRQWNKLRKTYLRKEYSRSHVRYWLTLVRGSLSINEIAIASNRSHWAVRDALIKDAQFGLVCAENTRVAGSKAPYLKFYSLSPKGQKLIKILDELLLHEKESINPRGSGT